MAKKNGYAWGHYGITLEAKAKLLDNYVFRWDKVTGNPGIDEINLKRFLMHNYSIGVLYFPTFSFIYNIC